MAAAARPLACIAAIVALALLGCEREASKPTGSSAAPKGGGEVAQAPKPVIRWGVFKNYQPVFIAKELGYFEEEGLDLQFTGTFTSGPAIVQAAMAGEIDAGHSAISGIVNAVAAGAEVIGVADSQTEFKDAPLMRWFVKEDGPASAADVRGKKIGVNSLSGSFYYTVLEYLRQNGMTKDDVQFVVIPHHNQEQALRAGQIDVAGIIDPYSNHAEQTGGLRILFRAADVLGEVQFSHVFFRKEIVEKRPDDVRAFVRAYHRAIEFISAEPDRAGEIMAKAIGVEANLVGVHRYTPGAEVRPADVEFWMRMMRDGGELRDNGRLTVDDVATTRFKADQ